jgi:hypothetical protein
VCLPMNNIRTVVKFLVVRGLSWFSYSSMMLYASPSIVHHDYVVSVAGLLQH